MKAYRETFNDGFLQYGHKKTLRSENKKKIGETFIPVGKLAFKEMSSRESDYQLAETSGHQLDLKVKTPYPPSFRIQRKSKMKVVIDGVEYDVIKVDNDPNKRYLYFHLQEVGISNE